MISMLIGPSGSGKTVFLTNMILDIYKGCFSIIYIWSPSIDVDNTWKPVKDYTRDHIKPNGRENMLFWFIRSIRTWTSYKYTTKHYKLSKTHKDVYQTLIVIDDFAYDTNFTRKSQLLHELYIRGRHYMIITITSTQKQISPIVRNTITHLFIYRLRNYNDLESIVEELNAIHDNNTLLQIYHEAVSEYYSFLYVNLMSKDKRNMFMERFGRYLTPS